MAARSQRKGARFIRHFGLLVLGLIVALVLAELLARAYVSWSGTAVVESRAPLPGTEFTDHNAAYNETYTFGEGGTRRPCGTNHKESSYSLAVIGDSFAFGVGVPDCQDFSSIVNREDPLVTVTNLGVPATGLKDYLEITEERVCDGGFDGVFLLLFGNDFLDGSIGLLRRAAEYSQLAGLVNLQLALNQPSESTLEMLVALGLFDEFPPGTPLSLPWNLVTAQPAGGGQRVLVTLANDISQAREFAVYLSFPPAGLAAVNLERLKDLLARLEKCAEDVWVAVVPNGAKLSPGQRAFIDSLGGYVPSLDEPDRVMTMVREATLERGAHYIETEAAFTPEADVAYHINDVHWTPRGHQIMASVLSDALATPLQPSPGASSLP